MRVLITGGTGLIGGAVARELGAAGHEAVVLTRDLSRMRPLTAGVRAVEWDGRTATGWKDLIDGDTAIVHLAGESIAAGRWTDERKRRIRDSRVGSGAAVAAAIRAAKEKPRGAAPGLGGRLLRPPRRRGGDRGRPARPRLPRRGLGRLGGLDGGGGGARRAPGAAAHRASCSPARGARCPRWRSPSS